MGAGKYVYYVPVEGGGPISIYFKSASVVKSNDKNKKKTIAPRVSPIKNLRMLSGSTVISGTKN